jgi:tetratricopeptide (TPR) repeat protein
MNKLSTLVSICILLSPVLPIYKVSAQTIVPTILISQANKSAKFYFDRAEEKSTSVNFDYKGAVADYDMAISIDPKYVDAYIGRSMAKTGLQDNQGAITDLNTAISIDPKSINAYLARAYIKHDFLKDKQGGISDMVKASELARDRGDMDSYQQAVKKIEEWKSS